MLKRWSTIMTGMALGFFGVSYGTFNPGMTIVQWGSDAHGIVYFLLFVGLLLSVSTIVGYVLKRCVGLPGVAASIVTGIALGPSGVNISRWCGFDALVHFIDYHGVMYTVPLYDLFMYIVLVISGAFTVSFLLFFAGYETNVGEMRLVGLVAIIAGVLGALLPMALTVVCGWLMSGYVAWSPIVWLGIGLVLAATSVSIPVAMLFEAHKMQLRSSKATLAAAVIDDVVAVLLVSLFFVLLSYGCLGAGHTGGCTVHLGRLLIGLCVYLAVGGVFGYWVLPRLLRWSDRYGVGSVGLMATVTMIVYFVGAELCAGIAGITGAYAAGLFFRIGEQKQREHEVRALISPFVDMLFVPLFLVSVGLQVDVRVLTVADWILVVCILIIAIVSKLIACFMATSSYVIWTDKPWRMVERYLFGAAMVARGEVGLVVATMLQGAQVITPNQYVLLVVVIVGTTIATPIMLHQGFIRYGEDSQSTVADGYVTVIIPVKNEITGHAYSDLLVRYLVAAGYSVGQHTSGDSMILGPAIQEGVLLVCQEHQCSLVGRRNDIQQVKIDLKRFFVREWAWLEG